MMVVTMVSGVVLTFMVDDSGGCSCIGGGGCSGCFGCSNSGGDDVGDDGVGGGDGGRSD